MGGMEVEGGGVGRVDVDGASVALAEGGVEGEGAPKVLCLCVEGVFGSGVVFGLVPSAGNTFLLDLREDGVEGALDDVLALGLGGPFGKFYFGWVVVGLWVGFGEGVLGLLGVGE